MLMTARGRLYDGHKGVINRSSTIALIFDDDRERPYADHEGSRIDDRKRSFL
jgi:hypothetical protein